MHVLLNLLKKNYVILVDFSTENPSTNGWTKGKFSIIDVKMPN